MKNSKEKVGRTVTNATADLGLFRVAIVDYHIVNLCNKCDSLFKGVNCSEIVQCIYRQLALEIKLQNLSSEILK